VAGSGWVRVAALSEFDETRRLVRNVNGVDVLLCQLASGMVAVRDRCTHLGQPLSQGRLMAGRIHCPFHGACFDLRTGEALSGPAVAPLQRYGLRIEGDDVFILEQSDSAVALSGAPPPSNI
jgi:nitrite reductase/ring-hydroxylating ferredoxin subunit